jgi:hypothetical protein
VCETLGLLVSAIPGVKYGKLYYRYLESNKIHALNSNKGNFDAYMHISYKVKQDLSWWINGGLNDGNPISHAPPRVIIETDASGFGWGGTIPARNLFTKGLWSDKEKDMHINCLELKAILFIS